MKRLPLWIIVSMAVLTAMLLVVGWDERHHAGWLPFVVGVAFLLFTLGSLGALVRDDGRDEG